MMNTENQDMLFEDLATQAINSGSYQSQADLAQQIDSITPNDALTVSYFCCLYAHLIWRGGCLTLIYRTHFEDVQVQCQSGVNHIYEG